MPEPTPTTLAIDVASARLRDLQRLRSLESLLLDFGTGGIIGLDGDRNSVQLRIDVGGIALYKECKPMRDTLPAAVARDACRAAIEVVRRHVESERARLLGGPDA